MKHHIGGTYICTMLANIRQTFKITPGNHVTRPRSYCSSSFGRYVLIDMLSKEWIESTNTASCIEQLCCSVAHTQFYSSAMHNVRTHCPDSILTLTLPLLRIYTLTQLCRGEGKICQTVQQLKPCRQLGKFMLSVVWRSATDGSIYIYIYIIEQNDSGGLIKDSNMCIEETTAMGCAGPAINRIW